MLLSRNKEDYSDPTNIRHPFWSSTTGSTLRLTLIEIPGSNTKSESISMEVTVHSISEPYVYKMLVYQEDVDNPTVLFKRKKYAIKTIKNQWWDYYKNRTEVVFKEHINVDISKLPGYKDTMNLTSSSDDSPIISPKRQNFVDSCPPTPSPRSIRKSSIKSMARLSLVNIKRKKSNSSQIFDLSDESPDSSRDQSPRSPGWLRRRLSLPNKLLRNQSPRSGDSSERVSSNNSPRTQVTLSRKTSELLSDVSIRLAATKRESDIKTNYNLPRTPRNSDASEFHIDSK